MIDGRDEGVPTGTLYRITFHWCQNRKRVEWEEVSPDTISKPPRYDHRYQVLGTWNSGRMDDMKCKDGVWEYTGKIGVSGTEEFQLCRDSDDQQLIYPARAHTTTTTVAVRGPDDLGAGKMWQVTGAVGEMVKIRLEVNDGQVLVTVTTKSQGEKVWESQEGWERHSYWLQFIGGPAEQMTMDPEAPGVFRARGTIGQNYYEKYRGLCEFFNIVVDEDPNFGFFPDVAYASSTECICWGPERIPTESPFMVKSLQAGAGFEVVLNTRATDMRKRVTWTWDTPPQFNFAAMLMG